MSIVFPLELRSGQCVDAVILHMRSDEFHEGYLPAEIEGGDETITPSCNLEPDALAVQHLRSWSRFLDLIR